MAIIKLKRARNSLLNVSKLPPEIFGEIFRYNATLTTCLGPLDEESHNFFLVCHYWFNVASSILEIWSFWGYNLQDWTKRYLRHPTAPLNLTLDDAKFDFTNVTLDDSLRNALQARAAQDTIRRIHLVARDSRILNSIISSLTGHEGVRSSSVEVVHLRFENPRNPPIVSDFFAYHRFQKLRYLTLSHCIIPSWDLKTSLLTRLQLDGRFPSSTITSPRILSILRSNPLLQDILLNGYAIPDDGVVESSRVPLAHLTKLILDGRLRDVFMLLLQLDCPGRMDFLSLGLTDGRVEDIPGVVGPYLRDYVRRRGRSQNGLSFSLASDNPIELWIGDTEAVSLPVPEFFRTFAEIYIELGQDLSGEGSLDLIACVPREEVTYFETHGFPISMEAISTQFPSLKGVRFSRTHLHVAFPESNLDRDKIPSSLQHIRLDMWTVNGVQRSDWNLLANFLDRLASSGNRLGELCFRGSCDVDPDVEERFARAVREFSILD